LYWFFLLLLFFFFWQGNQLLTTFMFVVTLSSLFRKFNLIKMSSLTEMGPSFLNACGIKNT
jgi:hypothetical protein